MESIKLTLKNHPVTGWALVLFLALGGLLAFANQLMTFLKNVGLMP